MKHFLKLKTGFTLIELLVVVAIIGVLTAVLLVNLVGIRERGADAKKKSDLNQVKNALRLHYNDNQSYPASSNGLIMGCGSDGDAACSEGSDLGNSDTTYMKSIPEYTSYISDGETFSIGVILNNESDQEAATSADRCGVVAQPGVFFVCTD